MTFKLSRRSRDNLIGVKPDLVAVVERAIEITTVDFAVTEGVRTAARQRELFLRGVSQIAEGGKHVSGEAVDLVAFLDGRISWELNLYDEIAGAMKQAAVEKDVALRWGAAWNVSDIRAWGGTMEAAMNYYIDARRKAGKRPFIDAPHFEMV
jgi:peptidoglycan L-alanyl-D-glutamate endopeptidase CwlK